MKLNGLDLNKIHVFFVVVKHAGYKGAAEELNLTRSALSQAISNLESRFGITLFNRVGRKLIPTPAALIFYEKVAQYQFQLQESVKVLVGDTGRSEGILRIGTYSEFVKSKIINWVETFLVRNPQVQIKFTLDSPSRLEALLENQKIDLAISIFPPKKSQIIYSRKLCKEELVLVGLPKLIAKRPVATQFQKVPIIDYFPNHVLFKRWWNVHYAKNTFKGSIRIYAASAETVLEFVMRGLGVGVVPKYLLKAHPQYKQLQIIRPSKRLLQDYIWLNERKDAHKSMVQQNFTKLLVSQWEA